MASIQPIKNKTGGFQSLPPKKEKNHKSTSQQG